MFRLHRIFALLGVLAVCASTQTGSLSAQECKKKSSCKSQQKVQTEPCPERQKPAPPCPPPPAPEPVYPVAPPVTRTIAPRIMPDVHAVEADRASHAARVISDFAGM